MSPKATALTDRSWNMTATRTDAARRTNARFRIRPAVLHDARALARLSSQLGYPSSREQVQRRLREILADSGHAVFVAERWHPRGADSALAGWVHVYIERTLESDCTAELGGLVVEESGRRLGAGRLLMERAERWARRMGCPTVTVRSNVLRTGAHAFYRRLGYRLVKNQRVFRKRLEPAQQPVSK
jgi:GNAT superfamily N-acetyltransferase